MSKHLAFLRYGVGTLASALDLWFMLATLLYAFDRRIPWWVWVFIVTEFCTVVIGAARYKRESGK